MGIFLAVTALLLFGGCCVFPFASLAYQRYRIGSFCESIVKGEPIDEVKRRARDKGFDVHDPQALVPGFNSEVIVRTDFLLAHLLCSVKHDGQKVESVERSELW